MCTICPAQKCHMYKFKHYLESTVRHLLIMRRNIEAYFFSQIGRLQAENFKKQMKEFHG